mmetsp:Transcript_57662/g.134938  ORF Transcript_57662/g.134938 Transcript_57662/m.134938 type:complete len:236 (+) Transcript_57662:44-751(+)
MPNWGGPEYSIGTSEASGHGPKKVWNQDTVEHRCTFHIPRSVSAAAHIGPGHYRAERLFPTVADEFKSGKSARRWRVKAPGHAFGMEPRMTPDGIMKGVLHPSCTRKGPGDYPTVPTSLTKRSVPSQTVPKAKEVAEEVRYRHARGNGPGPGSYPPPPTTLANISREHEQCHSSVPGGMKECHWQSQFNHMFSTVKYANGARARVPEPLAEKSISSWTAPASLSSARSHPDLSRG